jgi:hypothetical protein
MTDERLGAGNRRVIYRGLPAHRHTSFALGCALALASGASLFLAPAPARAEGQEAYYEQTWTEGTPVLNTTNSVWPYGTPIYPVCVDGDVDIYAISSGRYPFTSKGIYPTTRVFLYKDCYLPSGQAWPGSPKNFNVPAGYLLIYRVLFYWTGNGWTTCTADSGWISNDQPAWVMSLSTPGVQPFTEYGTNSKDLVSHGSSAIATYPPSPSGGYGPCGAGYYDMGALVYAWTGTQWLGGAIYSGVAYSD